MADQIGPLEIYSSRDSVVLIGSTQIEGIQSIDWKVNRNRKDVTGTGQPLRLGVEYGVKEISGSIKVKSSINELDKRLSNTDLHEAMFDLHITLKKQGGVGSESKAAEDWKLDFTGCYLDGRDLSMDVNGTPIAVYTFTATDVNENLG
jgi:hypothetical protein